MWTPGALASEARPWAGAIWRVVESQSHVSTMKLVDHLDDQHLLERIIDATKPAMPPECARLHFLLATPFRYAPYPVGSRFRRAGQPDGCFYGSLRIETAIAELAFYRLLFFAEAPGMTRPTNALEHTGFSVRAATPAAIDLARPPLAGDEARWTHPTDYRTCQDLADAARDTAIGAILYRSVRDGAGAGGGGGGGGTNVALLRPDALVSTAPEERQTWRILVGRTGVVAFPDLGRALEFAIARWAGDPRIAGLVRR